MPQVSSYHAKDHWLQLQAYHQPSSAALSFVQRLMHHIDKFRGCPYELGACGEGPTGEFNQRPLYRVDAVDCLTFVNTVLALTLAEHTDQIESMIVALNYYEKRVAYHTRFHSMALDWLPMNTDAGYIYPLFERLSVPAACLSETIVQKDWLYEKTDKDFFFIEPWSHKKKQERMQLFQSYSARAENKKASVNYHLISDIQSSWALFTDRLPVVSLMVVVRPVYNMDRACIALVSHVGFIVNQGGKQSFIHAKQDQCVCEESLFDYLTRCHANPPIRGVAFYGLPGSA